MTDALPSGLTFVSAIPSQGTYDPGTGLWSVGTVNVGSPVTLVDPGDGHQPRPADQHGDDHPRRPVRPGHRQQHRHAPPTTPQQADLALAKTVSNPTPNVGDTITYTITLTDNGPDSATNVNVSDVLPAGLDVVSASTTVGSYNPVTGLWKVGTVAPGTPQTLQIAALVAGPNATTNTATITQADQFDPDPANNTASILVTPQQADLSLTKSVSDPTPNVGDTITYTITLGDSGPDAATGVQVQDALPSGLTFVSATPSQGTYDSASGLWSVGTVNVGSPVTLTIQATVTSPNPQTNTATISHADQFDPNTTNNTATPSSDPAAGRPGPDQDRGQPDPQRRRHRHLHRHPEQQRPGRRHGRPGDRPAPFGSVVRVGYDEPGDLRPRHGPLECGDGRCRVAGDALDPGDGHEPEPRDQHGDDHPLRPVRPQPRQQQRHRPRLAAAGRPGPDQDRGRRHSQRG